MQGTDCCLEEFADSWNITQYQLKMADLNSGTEISARWSDFSMYLMQCNWYMNKSTSMWFFCLLFDNKTFYPQGFSLSLSLSLLGSESPAHPYTTLCIRTHHRITFRGWDCMCLFFSDLSNSIAKADFRNHFLYIFICSDLNAKKILSLGWKYPRHTDEQRHSTKLRAISFLCGPPSSLDPCLLHLLKCIHKWLSQQLYTWICSI